ncbi:MULTISPECIES: hypothetical protein [unclassified Tolypothrix]|uniref:hypothetical protein n=1 Tax=unclassified Tolypothrix TaxID=2649714 RepID=UPI0005EAAD40|nr:MULTISPECIES: hypothetical protein [unclassified Tolypothrix]BAY95075.1 hypothetical protein NIES3275_71320 [Microchaete diplosiphon NIES-3275]EKE97996.1 hypothetical protein FDUTEX481_04565 [Tolypothrix sp. PCC 7601]MBE9080638.1 hypothetical protein [Tolypothrix sp. LEGE 11397]UYD30403.1 hypothetical protein HGR01_35990 [Tolypothrix sp. PCC 7712]UYD38155.1 hypothetical protein HG267_37265 [Tolypothrix sp. PCC 7601]
MLKKFAFNGLRNLNAAFGMVSLTAIALGTVATFSGLGLLCLARGGFSIVEKERSEQIAYIGTGAIVLGFTGIIFASLGGAFFSIVEESEETNSSREIAKIADTKPLVLTKTENSEKSDCLSSIYTYTVMNFERHSDSKCLVVSRFEEEPYRKFVLYEELRSHQIDDLAVIYDETDPDRLIGQTFSSYQALPCEALEEHLDIHRRYINAVNSEEFSSCYLQVCAGCKLLHGANNIVCGIHPHGCLENSCCPDKQWDERKALFPFEDDAVVENLNREISSNQANIYKFYGNLILWDEYANRRFSFSYSGILLKHSDRLLELGMEATLLSYIQYFRTRNVVVFDYVASGRVLEFAKELKGIAQIEVDGDEISIFFDIYAPCHRFRRDGVSLHPYSTFVPQELRYNYNFVSYVNYLKSKKSGVLR